MRRRPHSFPIQDESLMTVPVAKEMKMCTWADAVWAIRFYERYGFRLVGRMETERLLKKFGPCPSARLKPPWFGPIRNGMKRRDES